MEAKIMLSQYEYNSLQSKIREQKEEILKLRGDKFALVYSGGSIQYRNPLELVKVIKAEYDKNLEWIKSEEQRIYNEKNSEYRQENLRLENQLKHLMLQIGEYNKEGGVYRYFTRLKPKKNDIF